MAVATREEIRRKLLSMSPTEFISLRLFDAIPYIFSANLESWVQWKHVLSGYLGVDPYEIVLTGSSAVGYSMNPNKGLAPFHDSSDVDVGIVSSHHFDAAWRHLRQLGAEILARPAPLREAVKSHKARYVFAGTIAAERVLELLPFAREWQRGLDEMSKLEPTRGREIALRIYRDFDSLRAYQIDSIRKLRDSVLSLHSERSGSDVIMTEAE